MASSPATYEVGYFMLVEEMIKQWLHNCGTVLFALSSRRFQCCHLIQGSADKYCSGSLLLVWENGWYCSCHFLLWSQERGYKQDSAQNKTPFSFLFTSATRLGPEQKLFMNWNWHCSAWIPTLLVVDNLNPSATEPHLAEHHTLGA